MKLMKKDNKDSKQIWTNEEYMDYVSSKYDTDDDIEEPILDSDDAYENLKNYIEELYEKQEKVKKI